MHKIKTQQNTINKSVIKEKGPAQFVIKTGAKGEPRRGTAHAAQEQPAKCTTCWKGRVKVHLLRVYAGIIYK